MWSLDTRWFDVAMIFGIFAFGNVCFGRFEEHKPRGQRVTKVILVTALVVTLAEFAGRPVAYSVVAAFGLLALYVHVWWLPAHGINGWTAEPRDQYLALMNKKKG